MLASTRETQDAVAVGDEVAGGGELADVGGAELATVVDD
jgi:hypothetical protein